ncbi:unnamed protein product [Phyllotreta striolata]|uniref:Uncharacterized protein n=1 Tax=Phyllotreta striolata TaxID=444603 RepID=A0A9N9TQ55_PHYSR|nr:unnamed protein product [Phyllotreta striolata]
MMRYIGFLAVFVGFFVSFCYGDYEGELNDPCQIVKECRQHAYLCSSNRTCQCLPFYRPNKYWDKCIGIIGQKCKYDEHCIEGAYCKHQQICECKENLFPNEDKTECSFPVFSDSSRNTSNKYIVTSLLILMYIKLYRII